MRSYVPNIVCFFTVVFGCKPRPRSLLGAHRGSKCLSVVVFLKDSFWVALLEVLMALLLFMRSIELLK